MNRNAILRNIGFSLIELMVAVAIVGILAAIAYPSYSSHVVKSNRAAAEAHLMDIAQQEQQYLLDNRTYTSSLTDLNLTTPSDVSNYYTISITISAGPPPTFTAIATPIAGTAQMNDGTLSINNAGTKTPSTAW